MPEPEEAFEEVLVTFLVLELEEGLLPELEPEIESLTPETFLEELELDLELELEDFELDLELPELLLFNKPIEIGLL